MKFVTFFRATIQYNTYERMLLYSLQFANGLRLETWLGSCFYEKNHLSQVQRLTWVRSWQNRVFHFVETSFIWEWIHLIQMRSHLNVGAISLRCDDPFIPEQIKRKNRYLDLMEFYLKKKKQLNQRKQSKFIRCCKEITLCGFFGWASFQNNKVALRKPWVCETHVVIVMFRIHRS